MHAVVSFLTNRKEGKNSQEQYAGGVVAVVAFLSIHLYLS